VLRALILFGLIIGGSASAALADGTPPPAPQKQTAAEAQLKSAGCMSCHTTTDSLTMHTSPGVILGCADCHGGNAAAFLTPGTPPDTVAALRKAFHDTMNDPAFIAEAERQHLEIQDVDGDTNFCASAFVRVEAQPIADYLLISTDRGLDTTSLRIA